VYVDHLIFDLRASAADALEHALEILGGLARQDLHQSDVRLAIEDHDEQPLLADQADVDALVHALLQDVAKVLLAQDLGHLP